MHNGQRPFLAFQIQITSRCNLRCPLCTKQAFASDWVEGDMEMAVFRAAAEAFPALRQVYIDAWGEPLLHPRVWEMVAMARAAGCSVGITTNGTLIDGEVARRLARELDVVGISIDGATAPTYEAIRRGARFEAVVSGIRELVAARRAVRPEGLPLISILFLKRRRNIHELPALVDLAVELGADEVIASNLTFPATLAAAAEAVYDLRAPASDDLAILDKARRRAALSGISLQIYPLSPKRVGFCEARPMESLYITWDGDVSPCVYLTLPLKSRTLSKVYEGKTYSIPATRFGNLKKASLFEIWDRPDYRRFREPFARRRVLCGRQRFGITDDGGFDEIDPETFNALGRYPPPEVCSGCYKALGI